MTSAARPLAAVLSGATLLGSANALAEPLQIRGDVGQSAAIALSLSGAFGVTELFLKPHLAPSPARWPDRAPDGTDTLNSLDRTVSGLRWDRVALARGLSDIGLVVSSLSAFGVSAIAAAQHGEPPLEIALDAAIIAESTAVAMIINQATKFIAGRERPCKHFAVAWSSRSRPLPPASMGPCGADRFDDNLSSFSGHTTLVASSWASSATVATLRGNALAPLLWGSGVVITVTTAYLRIAAGKHYLTDVVVGAVLGAAIGFLVPWTFHGRVSALDTSRYGPIDAGSAPSRAFGKRLDESGWRFSFAF